MGEARQRAEWARTAAVVWVVAEAHRDARRRQTPYTPSDFDPTARQIEERHPEISTERFVSLFVQE